jgi:hypothetical protein
MKVQQMKIAIWTLMAIAMPLATLHAENIEPPKVQLVDKFGVNMANGQVTHSIGLVSIGSAMGLDDTISVYANEFNYTGYRGFNHKYWATASDVTINNSNVPGLTPRHIMRVYGPVGSADFAYYVGGVLQDYGTATSGYTYVPLGDARNTLDAIGEELVWTTANGTVLRFARAGENPRPASFGGLLKSIEYPNGFIVTITAGGISVNTNTGFQLKQVFEADTANCFNVYPLVRTSAESGWSLHNPKQIVAINAAHEHCAVTEATCPLTMNWPKATIQWPSCMPDILYRQNTQVSVTNSKGVKTTFKYKRDDLAYEDVQGGAVAEGYQLGQEFSSRLASISAPNNADVPVVSYSYKNLFTTFGNSEGSVDYRLQKSGVILGAERGGVAGASYDIFRPYQGADSENIGGPNNGVNLVRVRGMVHGAVGVIDYAETENGRIDFEATPRNFPTNFQKHSAPQEVYSYDSRGNLTSIEYYGSPGYSFVAAEYPATCTPTTRKTCNQATRIRDANGNWTDYTYHEASGQVASITQPPNKRGLRAQTRFSYEQRQANYYGPAGSMIQGTPIWMKTAEEYCINSAASGGNCGGNDEVVTTYEYNHNNLLLTGVTVTTPDGVRRTCYQYDRLGNQISVTTPNANLSSCAGGTP